MITQVFDKVERGAHECTQRTFSAARARERDDDSTQLEPKGRLLAGVDREGTVEAGEGIRVPQFKNCERLSSIYLVIRSLMKF